MDPTVCLLVASVLVAYQTPDREPLSVTVELFNDAGAPDRLLNAAQNEAARILTGSEVHLVWVNGPRHDSRAPFRIVITPDELRTNNPQGVVWVLGKTSIRSQARRDRSLVSYPSVLRTTFTSRVSPQRMLGAVITHELAHLLMPPGWHDRPPVMRRTWDNTDFQLLALGQLGFASVSARLLRAAVAQTMHTSVDLTASSGAAGDHPRRYQ